MSDKNSYRVNLQYCMNNDLLQIQSVANLIRFILNVSTSFTSDIFVFSIFQHLRFSYKSLLMCPWKLAPMWHYLVTSRVIQNQRSNGEDWTTCQFSQDPSQLVPSASWEQALSLFQVGWRMCVCACVFVHLIIYILLYVCFLFLHSSLFVFLLWTQRFSMVAQKGFWPLSSFFSLLCATIPDSIYRYVCS